MALSSNHVLSCWEVLSLPVYIASSHSAVGSRNEYLALDSGRQLCIQSLCIICSMAEYFREKLMVLVEQMRQGIKCEVLWALGTGHWLC